MPRPRTDRHRPAATRLADPLEGCRRLAAAVVTRAFHDLAGGPEVQHAQALHYFRHVFPEEGHLWRALVGHVLVWQRFLDRVREADLEWADYMRARLLRLHGEGRVQYEHGAWEIKSLTDHKSGKRWRKALPGEAGLLRELAAARFQDGR